MVPAGILNTLNPVPSRARPSCASPTPSLVPAASDSGFLRVPGLGLRVLC